jgi:hypothetical protein
MWCVGCGERLDERADACASCGTRAIGASFSEQVVVRDGQALRIPPVCACCLAGGAGAEEHGFTGSQVLGRKRFRMSVPIPWCAQCQTTRRSLARMNTVAGLALACAAWFGSGPFDLELGARVALVFVAGLAGVLASGLGMPAVLSSLRAPGHVPGCQAVSGSVGAREARLTLANRGFARIWRELQAGIECRAPALLAARVGAPAHTAAPAATRPVNAEAERKLSALALRQQAKVAAAPSAPAGRHSAGGGRRVVAADALADLLRGTAKECRFTDDAIEARLSDGSERSVAWSEVTLVCVRQLPAEPPFAAALLLDLGLRDRSVLRLLASTRGNFSALPGAGLTSQENFRRLAGHVLTRHADATLEPESVPFLREGKAPPRCETVSRFEEYDARYS